METRINKSSNSKSRVRRFNMRAFIAIDIPEDARKELVKLQKMLPEFKGKLTESENLHLTLKFLGEMDEKQAEEVKERLGKIKLRKFKIVINEVGVFSEKLIRIVWVGADEKCKELWKLQEKIDDSLKGMFEKEKRFMGHITIARVKSVKDKKKFLDKLEKIKFKDIELEVKEFKLKSSKLTEKGPVYEDLLEVKLI